MAITDPPLFTRGQVVSTLAVGTIGMLMIGLQPILLGELVETKRITLEGVGVVAMGEIVALGLGVILGDTLLPLARLRLVTVVAALLTALFDLATLWVGGDAGFTAARVAAGLSEGVLVWVATCVIVRTAAPDRLAGIFLVVQTMAQAAVAAGLAITVIPRGGWQAGFVALAIASLLACVLARWQPRRVEPLVPAATPKLRWTLPSVLTLATVFAQLAAIGSLWAYLEPLGKSAGLDAQSSQTLISGVLLMQVIGGCAAAVVVRRFMAMSILAAGALVLGTIALGIHWLPAGATVRFALLCAAFGFAWLFLMPFHIGLAFRADPAGRVAVLVPAMQLLGSAFGPLVASLIVTGEDAGPVPMVSAVFALLAVITLAALRGRSPVIASRRVG